MIELLRDLYSHQSWADAQLWQALESHPGALRDAEVCERLYHIHLTQYAFLTILQRGEFLYKRLEDFPDMKSLKIFAMENHSRALTFLQSLSDAQLDETFDIPWFRDPPLKLKAVHALSQAAMHSQYHRGQNARRLRELGGQPPLTDFIAWYWKGCPNAEW